MNIEGTAAETLLYEAQYAARTENLDDPARWLKHMIEALCTVDIALGGALTVTVLPMLEKILIMIGGDADMNSKMDGMQTSIDDGEEQIEDLKFDLDEANDTIKELTADVARLHDMLTAAL